MVLKRLFSKQSAIQASLLMVTFSVLSKAMGLVREMVIAHKLGSSSEYDLYLVVYMLPSALTTAILYTLSKAVIPFSQQVRTSCGDQKADIYAWRILIVGALFFISIWGISAIWAVPIMTRLLPGASSQTLDAAAKMFRLLGFMPSLFFWHTTVASLLQSERYFMVSSFDVLLLNTILISTLLFSRNAGAWTLAWGMILGLSSQVMWVSFFYFGKKSNFPFRSLFKTSIPSFYYSGLLASIFQIALIEICGTPVWTIIDRYLAQYFRLPVGSISCINYALTIYGIPLSIFNTGIGRAIFPFLSAYIVAGNTQLSKTFLEKGIKISLLILAPICLFFALFSHDLVSLIYLRGAFDIQSAEMTAFALRWLVGALFFDGLYVILATYLYAARQFKPLIISVLLSLLIKLATSYFLLQKFGYQGLAASSLIASFFRVLFIFTLASFKLDLNSLRRFFPKVLCGGAIAISAAAFVAARLQGVDGSTWPRLIRLLTAGAIFVGLYVGFLNLLQVAEITQMMQWLKYRLGMRG